MFYEQLKYFRYYSIGLNKNKKKSLMILPAYKQPIYTELTDPFIAVNYDTFDPSPHKYFGGK